MLAAVVIGSGIAAANLTDDTGLRLLENAAVTAAGLFTIILMFGPVSGGHFNPIVSRSTRRARSGRGGTAPAAVGAYIGAAYWFTSSTSFANPAVSVGRVFSDTFAGIAPASVPSFIGAQLIGGALALALVRARRRTDGRESRSRFRGAVRRSAGRCRRGA